MSDESICRLETSSVVGTSKKLPKSHIILYMYAAIAFHASMKDEYFDCAWEPYPDWIQQVGIVATVL